jgi:LacI family transcriptional regulator
MKRLPHVALLIETSRSFTRAMLRGIHTYIAGHGPWSVYLELRALDSDVPAWLRRWKGDGIITRTSSQEMADVIRRCGVPAIETRATKLRHNLPFVGVDNRALGRMVAEHLLERGFRHFGVYELDTEVFFEERRDTFVQTLRQRGFDCHVYRSPGRSEKPREWEKQQDDLARWVKSLPKPVGVMACTDQLGFWLLDACKRAEVAVPEEAAVVGVENDESLCSMSTPPLSSVQFPAERQGYIAAELLDRLMHGRKVPKETLLEPVGVVTRQSSDIVAIDDKPIAEAVRFIREHADASITVEDVLDAVPMSRSSLERRMRQAIGRSPKAEITRVRLNRVKQLLTDTDLPLAVIAARTGFEHPQYMSMMFKDNLGVTPGDYRKTSAAPL